MNEAYPSIIKDPSAINGNVILSPSVSFESCANQSRMPGDTLIGDILNHTLSEGGEKMLFLKGYLDKAPADPSDRMFSKDPGALARYHADLSILLGKRLRLHAVGIDDDGMRVLARAKDKFTSGLPIAEQQAGDYFTSFITDPRQKMPHRAMNFHGFTVRAGSSSVDLLTEKIPGVTANFTAQREAMGLFLHWSSDNVLRARAAGHKPEMTKRIYLNPQSKDAVAIFGTIIDEANKNGLTVKGKIWDRSQEASSDLGRRDQKTLRADTIVLYAGDDADALLGLVEQIYSKHKDSFAGRKTPKIPHKIADGVAIGEEPSSGESLTSTRSDLLGIVREEVLQMTSMKTGDVTPDKLPVVAKLFRETLALRAQERGFSPTNMAFNAKVA